MSPKDTADEFGIIALVEEEDYIKKVKRVNEQLQQRLKQGIERFHAQHKDDKNSWKGMERSQSVVQTEPDMDAEARRRPSRLSDLESQNGDVGGLDVLSSRAKQENSLKIAVLVCLIPE